MMDIDEELSLQIKKVFEDLDDGRSDIGWSMLVQKYDQKPNRRLPIAWVSGIAAVLAIAVGLWIFLSNDHKNEGNKNEVGQKKNRPELRKTLDSQPTTPILRQDGSLNSRGLAQPQLAKGNAATDRKSPEKTLSLPNNPLKDSKKPMLNADIRKSGIHQQTGIIELTVEKPITIKQDRTEPFKAVVQNKVDSSQHNVDKPQVAPQITKVTEPGTVKNTTEDFLLAESRAAANRTEKTTREKKVNSSKNSYEVFTGTFVNYFGDNDVKVNGGFGLNANLKVSKNLFLTVGAGISQNKITYRSYSPYRGDGLLYASPSYSTVNGGVANVLQTGFISNTKLNAQLLSLDLPITMKFYPTKKQNFYIATGFNSNTYFAQKYDYTYTVTSTSALASNLKTEFGETEKSKFKGFDLANSAIFAIGINKKIGKENMLIFEPYFKPAIGNMGDKNLRINSLGINLKFSFTQEDKK